jgi:hypothetical protein
MMVHSPISLPEDLEDNLGNSALLLLPVSGLLTFPDSLRRQLRLVPGAAITPTSTLPGLDAPLPPLEFGAFAINTLPFIVENTSIVPLYEAEYTYVTQDSRQGPWPGVSTIASISADRRIGLFSIPVINEQSAEPIVFGAGTTDPAPTRQALFMILDSLGFPKR